MQKPGPILSQRKQTPPHDILIENFAITQEHSNRVSSTKCVWCAFEHPRFSAGRFKLNHRRKVLIVIHPARCSGKYQNVNLDDERLFRVVTAYEPKKIENKNMWRLHKRLHKQHAKDAMRAGDSATNDVHASYQDCGGNSKLIWTQKLWPKLIPLLLTGSRWIRISVCTVISFHSIAIGRHAAHRSPFICLNLINMLLERGFVVGRLLGARVCCMQSTGTYVGIIIRRQSTRKQQKQQQKFRAKKVTKIFASAQHRLRTSNRIPVYYSIVRFFMILSVFPLLGLEPTEGRKKTWKRKSHSAHKAHTRVIEWAVRGRRAEKKESKASQCVRWDFLCFRSINCLVLIRSKSLLRQNPYIPS